MNKHHRGRARRGMGVAVPGHRIIGPRKKKLIDIADKHLNALGARGIHTHTVLKFLGINDIDFQKVTTKQWTGIIGRIVEFRRGMGV